MKTFKLHLIRHGLTQGNLEGRYIGRTDLPLCQEGREEIESIIDLYGYPRVQKVYASPLRRAVETAQLIYPDTFLQKVDALREYDFGVFENQTLDQLKEDPDYRRWMESGMDAPPQGGESKEQFQERLDFGLNQIFLDMMSQDITSAALVTHGGVIMALLAKYGLPQRPELEWQTENGKGYTMMTYTQLWVRDRFAEVVGTVPENLFDQPEDLGYRVMDYLPEDE